MVEGIMIGLMVVVLVVVLVMLVWVHRLRSTPPPMVDLAPLERRIEETERRLNERSDSVRGSLETTLRELSTHQTTAHGELRELLGTRFGELQVAILKDIADRMETGRTAQAKDLVEARKNQDERLDKLGEASTASLESLRTNMQQQLTKMQETTTVALKEVQDRMTASLKEVREKMETQLGEMRRENEAKLEKIRETVDEKLQTTLEKRLGESFRTVSQQLESVQKGLGEMQVLASGVGDLKKVLSNVSSRGALGELQLARLLEEVMAPNQYESNVVVVPGKNERVDFAIKLPGRGDDETSVYLPIDAKFPTEDYQRLVEAYETGDAEEIKKQRKNLATRLKNEAMKIREKYVCPPHTTDFALLFLPVEGLYAEALRVPGLFEELQRSHKVTLCGPLTTVALLNSLQMGFRTLAIEKRSSEVWEVLTAVKTEFGKFGESIDAVGKSLEQARTRLDQVGVRSRAVGRRLRGVGTIDEDSARKLLFATEDEEPNEDGQL